MKQSVIDKKIIDREALELEKFYNHFSDIIKDIKHTQFEVEDVFDYKLGKHSILPEETSKSKNC